MCLLLVLSDSLHLHKGVGDLELLHLSVQGVAMEMQVCMVLLSGCRTSTQLLMLMLGSDYGWSNCSTDRGSILCWAWREEC